MEGNLYKWTNYWNGWQMRYFSLKEGVLSYYNTQEESKSGGCKRSFKISMFDIIVNKNDSTRVDLIIPNEQYLYLKALDYKERQKWLVALASQKATTTNLNNIVNSTPKLGDEASKYTGGQGSPSPDAAQTFDSLIKPGNSFLNIIISQLIREGLINKTK